MLRKGSWGSAVLPLLSLSILAPLAGCGPGDEADGAASELAVVLGTGLERYAPIEGEPTLTLIKGFQGGFHVWASFLTYGFETTVLRMELDTTWDGYPDSSVPMHGNVRLREATDAQGRPATGVVGWPAVIHEPTCAHGRRIRLDITVRDETSGAEASDERFFVADVPEADRAPSCAP